MKTIKVRVLTGILMLAVASIVAVSCNTEEEVDKAALLTAITDAKALIASTSEGTAEGQYLPGSMAVFQAVIDAADIVSADELATQVDVDNTVIALTAATTAYNGNIVAAIAPASLVGHWTFDDGSGTVLTDHSGNGYNGTLMSGASEWGGGMPTWSMDRYGNATGALMFDEGSHVLIANNAALSPANLSISLWLKAAEVLENNRFIGLHSWNGYKFQLQSANKAFFTIASSDGIYDRDTNPELVVDTWYHVVVTFGGGSMKFYVNGTETQVWDDTPGTAMPVTGNDLVFGQDSDVYAANGDNYDNDKIIPLDWGGYFHGSMDEVRMYSTVLTAAQVLSIFELEKVVE